MISRKSFARVKEAIAACRPKAAEAVASAQVLDIGLARDPQSGRSGEDAARRAALVSLGKKSILYRFGNAQNERSGAIEELVLILKAEGRKFSHPWTAIVAATALHELKDSQCQVCRGRGVVPDHAVEALEGRQPMRECGGCHGQKRRRWNEDDRVLMMARFFVDLTVTAETGEEFNALTSDAATALRKSRRLADMRHAVDFAKHVLIDAERAAVEGAGLAL